MTFVAHDNYAKDLLEFLAGDKAAAGLNQFAPNSAQSRNAAKAMTALLCHRLFINSKQRPVRKTGTTYAWRNGTFNCRNIADRDYVWTNMRRGVADEMHESAETGPSAYLLSCCSPGEKTIKVWAIPEPILHDSLASLQFEVSGQKYTIQISTDKQRIDRFEASPDLTLYFRRFELAKSEQELLDQSREVDEVVKQHRADKRREKTTDEANHAIALKSHVTKLLKRTARELKNEGAFDPVGITDARDRVISSIVRRRGQPAFRQKLLMAYDGKCAISGCYVEAVLDAAHIIPYRGTKTNHPGNGLLLRTDIHTLFDLKLLAIDAATMTVVASPDLAGIIYDEYRGRPISVPDDPNSLPSREALEKHRRESGL